MSVFRSFRPQSHVLTLFLLVFFGPTSLAVSHGQSATATLRGMVVDENEAVIPAVNVAVINIARRIQRNSLTDQSGEFVVPLLPPGSYTVKAEREGFNTTEVRDVVLNVNDQMSVKITLKVGRIADQNVEVVESTSALEESPGVSTVVDRQFTSNLPLNGHSFQSLIGLTPGTVLTKSNNGFEQGQFSVNGQRSNTNYFTVDGVSANIAVIASLFPGQGSAGSLPGLATTGGTNNLVSIDALEEFKVLTSSYAPEFGRTPGAQVSIVTRSGTKDFHGTIFEYFRNDALDANDWFANSRGLAKPPLRQNDFGFVLGGPVVAPAFGEGNSRAYYSRSDQTFFFLSYEGLRLRQPLVGITDVPGRLARQTASANNSVTAAYLNAYPLPTGPDRANGLAEFASSYSNPSTLNATSVRIDHIFNSRFTLFGRYNYAPSESLSRAGDGLRSLNSIRLFSNRTQTFTAGATHSLSAVAFNELRINFSNVKGNNRSSLDTFGGAAVPADSLFFPPFVSATDAFFRLSITGGRNASIQSGTNVSNRQRQFNVVDAFSVVKGSHQLKFGIDYRLLLPVIGIRGYAQTITFGNVTNAIASLASSAVVDAQTGPQELRYTNLSLFAQDAWRAQRRLTLTYGVRWELNPPPTELNGNSAFAVTGVENIPTMTLAPRGTALYQTTYNNFAPRVGVVYQLMEEAGKELIVRGGAGLFYDLGNAQTANAYGASFPFTATKRFTNITLPLSPAQIRPPAITTNLPVTSTIVIFDPHLKLPYSIQWNIAFEKSLGRHQTLTATYLAALGRRLLRQDALFNGASNNPVFASTSLFTRNSASSNYQALQLQFQRRLLQGLQALASYTWSHSIDIASNDSSANVPAEVIDVSQDRGDSDFDVRHAMSAAITYDIPHNRSTALRGVLQDWAIDSIFSARSATPVNVYFTTIAPFGVYQLRPDLRSDVPLYIHNQVEAGGHRINPAAFVVQTPTSQGSLGRNSLRGYPFWQLDFALHREFRLTERIKLQFRAELFNVFNHPNFGDPRFEDMSLGLSSAGQFFPNAAFGRSTSMLGRSLASGGTGTGGLNPLYQVGGPRSIQLAIKAQF
ncbi:MAG TPA: carboxypeptidase regulatory-like domain-containing protein [Pyrinomonadaceae bacterium]|nr:carboxypeptidase regulatory-like domain-containing protein [Pyrinomonadaceae bacterium]